MDRLRASSGVWIALERLSGPGIGLILNLALARMLSVGDLGRFYVTLSVVQGLAILWQQGMPELSVHSIAGKRQRVKPVLALSVALTLAVASLTVAPFAVPPVRQVASGLAEAAAIKNLLPIVAFWGMAFALRNLVSSSLLAAKNYLWSAISGTALPWILLLSGLGVVASLSGVSLATREVAIGAALATALVAMLALWEVIRRYPRGDWSECFSREFLGSFVAKGLAQGASNVGIVVLNQVDIWLLGVTFSSSSVGLYGAAVRLMLLARLPVLVGSLIAQPIIAELWRRPTGDRLQRYVSRVAARIAWSSLFIGIVLTIWADSILAVAFGQEFVGASAAFRILVVGQVVNGISGLGAVVLAMTGEQRAMATLTLISSVFAALAVFLAVRTGSLSWVAIAASMSVAMHNIAAAWLAKKRTSVRAWSIGRLLTR